MTSNFNRYSNKNCLWKLPENRFSLDAPSIDDLPALLKSGKEHCPSCNGTFIKNSVCTAASPFLVVYGDSNSLKDFPLHLELSYQTKKEIEV